MTVRFGSVIYTYGQEGMTLYSKGHDGLMIRPLGASRGAANHLIAEIAMIDHPRRPAASWSLPRSRVPIHRGVYLFQTNPKPSP